MQHGIDQITLFLFFSTWNVRKGVGKGSESVTVKLLYFDLNSQTNLMSVRREPAAARFNVCNFTLPSP